MFRRNSYCLAIALLVLAMVPTCPAAFKQGDPLPALDSFKLEGKLPEALKGQVILALPLDVHGS